jgi:hypothetical protein
VRYYSLLDKIRDDPELQQIVMDVEAKYRAEHERVRHCRGRMIVVIISLPNVSHIPKTPGPGSYFNSRSAVFLWIFFL